MEKSPNFQLKLGQQLAFRKLKKFIDNPLSKIFILKGFAGTGKTTMLRVLLEDLQERECKFSLMASTHYSKALYHTGQYHRCVELSKLALESFEVFHYSNDCWLARRMALCFKKMGNTHDAITNLEKLLKRKREWFILKELSEFYLEIGNNTKAMSYGKEAMIAYGSLAYKVELIEMLGDMMVNDDNAEQAYKHYVLAKLLREDEKWHINKQLHDKIAKYYGEYSHLAVSRRGLEAELKLTWTDSKIAIGSKQSGINVNLIRGNRISGVIVKLLDAKDSGQDGFIKNDNGGNAYFFMHKNNELYEKLKIGLKLEYETTISQNGKGDKAIRLKLI